VNVVVSSLTLMFGYLRVTASARPCQILRSSGVSDHIDQRRLTGPLPPPPPPPPPPSPPPQPGSPSRPAPARPAPAALRKPLRSRRSSLTVRSFPLDSRGHDRGPRGEARSGH